MIHDHTHRQYLAHRPFDPFRERAATPSAPIRIHPADPITSAASVFQTPPQPVAGP